MHVLGKLLRLGGGATGISALLLLCSVPSAPGAAPTVSIQPEGHIVDPGDPFVASLMVNAEAGTISTFDAVFRFNPEVVVLDSASQGSLYVNCDPGFFTWFGFEEESLGTWEAFEIIFPTMSYVVAPGEGIRLHFHAVAPGYTDIEFLSVTLTDIHRVPLDPLVGSDGYVCVGTPSGVETGEGGARHWNLGAPCPNPSPGGVRLALDRPAGGFGVCRAAVWDVRGRLVRSLADPSRTARSELCWDGRDGQGTEMPPGVYFVKLETPGRIIARKVVLLR